MVINLFIISFRVVKYTVANVSLYLFLLIDIFCRSVYFKCFYFIILFLIKNNLKIKESYCNNVRV